MKNKENNNPIDNIANDPMDNLINNPANPIKIRYLLEDISKPSIFQYLKLRIGMKLYKLKILRGWDYDPINNKVTFYWK